MIAFVLVIRGLWSTFRGLGVIPSTLWALVVVLILSKSLCKGIKIHFPLMSYGSETPHVWSSSACGRRRDAAVVRALAFHQAARNHVAVSRPWHNVAQPTFASDAACSISMKPSINCVGRLVLNIKLNHCMSSPGGKKARHRVASVAQRRAANIREQRRTFNLNEGFDRLRRKVPTFAYEKRLSRIETLRLAITYISFMCELLHGSPQPHHASHAIHPPRHVFDAEVPWCA
ncbi:hypothetical protein HF086_001028 [Spodoptera exigua]|uniref:BHLH domain-containing protein n=1 Tax=Spodoptera exigua TaxID=7107 RepID=A0A922SAX0_SPOEX|nr:hypothetical protein HF086_001028 [Spodoptera exigua]